MKKEFQIAFIVMSIITIALAGCASAAAPVQSPSAPSGSGATSPTTAQATATPRPAVSTATAAAIAPTQAPTAQPTAAPSTAPTTAPAVAASKDVCLGCHGPFDKLAASTVAYVAPSKEKGSPHRFVPHDKTGSQAIPECVNCHTAHPLSPPPTKGSIDKSKLNVEWCYTTCHHEKTLASCKTCHKETP